MRKVLRQIRHAYAIGVLLSGALACCSGVQAQTSLSGGDEPSDWVEVRDDATGVITQTMEMHIHPASPSRPSLKHQLIPAESDRVAGNAALFYLKAMGFFEQTNARDQLTEFHRKQSAMVSNGELEPGKVKPYVWLGTPPIELPVEEVKEFLQLTSFQPRFLAEAAKRRGFSFDRDIESSDNPIGYLLPEIQSFREAARMQSLRCRVAIAEGRTQDAFVTLGEQFAMANHLAGDDFFVSSLVGCAIENIAFVDALHLAQHADAPNYYWAYASLPRPIVDLRRANRFELSFLYLQLKALRDVDERLRPAGYWEDFIDRLVPQLAGFEIEGASAFTAAFHNAESVETKRAALVGMIAAAYPGARRFLIEDLGMDEAVVEEYPTTQAVMLAICRFYDYIVDEQAKWQLIDFDKAAQRRGFAEVDRELQSQAERLGWVVHFATMLLPAMQSIQAAQERADMSVALLQTVEALRAHADERGGALPENLADLSLPAPNNPVTGNAFEYRRHGGKGVLEATTRFLQYRLVLSVRP